MPISAETIVRRVDRLVFSSLDDEVLAIDAEHGFLYSLNETGRLVWDAIAEPRTVGDVCSRVRAEYDVDEATCQGAVIAVLERLGEAGLVELVQQPAGSDALSS